MPSFAPYSACMVRGASQHLAFASAGGENAIRWASSDSNVAQVSSDGLVSATRAGTAIITAAEAGHSDTAKITVTTGLVSFVIDDSHSTDYTVKKPIFSAKHAVGSLAVISRLPGLTDAQLREFKSEGWEILAHSRTHVREDSLSVAQLDSEIAGSQRDLAKRGFGTTVFVYPYGIHTHQVDSVVQQHFQAGLLAAWRYNTLPIRNWDAVRRANLGTRYARSGENTLAFYQSLVDTTRLHGDWLIFMIHEITPTDSANLSDILDYVDNQSLPILTVSDAIQRVKQVPAGGCAPAH